MDKDFSPEERLLRLIKLRTKKEDKVLPGAPKKVESKPASAPAAKPAAGTAKKAETVEGLAAHYSALLPQFKNIVIINKVLFILFVILMVYFLVDYFFMPSIEISKVLITEPEIEQTVEAEPVRHPYSYYEKEIAGKELFKPLVKDDFELAEAPEEELDDIATGFSLLGLVSGANPQAIIQDNAKKKTYFLNKGGRLGEATLKEILESEGRVTMIYRGREFDLAM